MKMVREGLTSKGFTPVVCAPTGKAAKRIQEATGFTAMTIHRLLEFTHPGETDDDGKPYGDSRPRRTRARPIEFDAVLCDEYAMVNQEIHQCLIEAMPPQSVLRVFGDSNQLAPIEDNPKFKDAPSAFIRLLNDFQGIRLETIHRQGEGSGIASNGWRILEGKTPIRHDDFFLRVTDDLTAELITRVRELQEKGIRFDVMENQIITPCARTSLGTRMLNQLLQTWYVDGPEMEPRDYLDVPRWSKKGEKIRMFVGDKVICTSNNYDLGVFNGETGIIRAMDDEFGVITIDFGDKLVEFPPVVPVFKPGGGMYHVDPRKNIDLAYAVTTHKAQGSEYGHVIYVMGAGSGRLRSRRNFYTGVTRARKTCSVLSDQKSLSFALWNTKDNF